MNWSIEGPFETGESSGWVPQAFGEIAVFRVGKGLFAWDLARHRKLWRKALPEDAGHGNKQSTRCGGYYVTFTDIADSHQPVPLFAVDPQTGETAWSTHVEAHCGGFEQGLTASSEAIFYHGYYEPDEQWSLFRIDPQTGEVLWKQPGQFADQVIWRDGHLFFGGGPHLTVKNENGETIHEFEQPSSPREWILSPGVDHTLLAGFMEPQTREWHLLLIDTRTLEVLGQMNDPAGNVGYTSGVRRGHFATIDEDRVVLIDALEEQHLGNRFAKTPLPPKRIVGAPSGYAVLHDCAHSGNRCFSLLDGQNGAIQETLELNGRATSVFWTGRRLVGFYLKKIHVITPHKAG